MDTREGGANSLTGGTVRGMVPVDVIATQADASNIIIRGLSLKGGSSQESLFKNLIGFLANESVVEEVSAGFMSSANFDLAAVSLTNAQSASIAFTGNGTPGQTVDVEMLGRGSRATAAYPTYTVTATSLPAIDSIFFPAGGLIQLRFSGIHGVVGDGEIVTISSTTETTAAGAAGTWNVFIFTASEVLLLNSSGTGTDCTGAVEELRLLRVRFAPRRWLRRWPFT